MAASLFEIVVSHRHVEGSLGEPGLMPIETPGADIPPDQLATDTVDVMDRWLNFWQLIKGSDIRHRESLFETKTFEVMGRQLWGLILNNKVGEKLLDRLDDAGAGPLRLVLTFTNNADTRLRGLPWEFLYAPRGHGFLAGRTGLLLTRYPYLEQSASRPTVTTVNNDQLRVLVLAALPDDRRFAANREDLTALWEALKNIDQLDPLPPIKSWDTASVREALGNAEKPCHIVHVIGICKGPPGAPTLFLGRGESGFEEPRELVELVCSGAALPQLVILQLCDYVDGDASENFERLAPALVEKGVPAVLALQYASPADEVGVGAAFYRSLIEEQPVGAAVQANRADLAKLVDRRFATPVLYLGNDGVLWKRSPEPPGASLGSASVSPSRTVVINGRPRPSSADYEVKALLASVARSDGLLRDGERDQLLDWISRLDLTGDPTETARDAIRLALRSAQSGATISAFGRMMEKISDAERDVGRVRV